MFKFVAALLLLAATAFAQPNDAIDILGGGTGCSGTKTISQLNGTYDTGSICTITNGSVSAGNCTSTGTDKILCRHNGSNVWVPLERAVFKTFDAPTGTDPVADTAADTLQLLASGGCMITGDATADSITIDCSSGGLSQEAVEDLVGAMVDDTETCIGVTYDDTNGNLEFVVTATDACITSVNWTKLIGSALISGPLTVQECSQMAGACSAFNVPQNIGPVREPVAGCSGGAFQFGKPVSRCAGLPQMTTAYECQTGYVRAGGDCLPYSSIGGAPPPALEVTDEQICTAINQSDCSTVLGAGDTVDGATILLPIDNTASDDTSGQTGPVIESARIVLDEDGNKYARQAVTIGAGDPALEQQTQIYFPNVPYDSRCDGAYHGGALFDPSTSNGDAYGGCSHIEIDDYWPDGVVGAPSDYGACIDSDGTEPNKLLYEDLDCNGAKSGGEPYIGNAAESDPLAILKTIGDAKGDIIGFTAADTPARLAASTTNADALVIDTSTSTGLKWKTLPYCASCEDCLEGGTSYVNGEAGYLRGDSWGLYWDYNGDAVRDATDWSVGRVFSHATDCTTFTCNTAHQNEICWERDADTLYWCEDDGTPAWTALAGGGGGDNVKVDTANVVDPDFQDGGDINFTNTANVVTATVSPNKITAAMMANGDHGDVSWTSNVATVENVQCGSACVGTTELVSGNVTYAKMQTMAGDDTLLCNYNGAGTAPEECTLGSGLSLGAGSVLTLTESDPLAIVKTIGDAKGDIIGFTAADTPARLAASTTNDDVLTVDTSTATGLKWAAAAGGDITDVFSCGGPDCASITMAATDLLDMSGTDASTTTEGLILPQHATLCAGGTAEGQPCWEADANILHIGDGATIKDFVSTAAFSADATVSTTGAVTVAAAIARDAEVPSLETDAAHDTCAEISGCVVGALTAEVNDLEGQDPASILTTEVYIGTGAGTGAFAALSGDVTMTNAGVVAVTDDSHNHGTSTIAALDAGDTTTGAFTDARVDGSLEADEVNPTLGTQTVGNYMVDVTAGVGIATTHTPAEGSNATVALSYASTLAGNPAFNAKECVFSTENGSGGFICEGTTAANTNEQLYLFPASDGADTTNYLTLANSTGAALTTVAADDGGDTTLNLALVADATGDKATLTDTALTYNGTTDVLTATLSGGASSVATSPAADDNDTSLATSAYVQTELNAAGGRSVTCASGSCDADTELYTATKCINIEFPISTDDLLFYRTPSAITIQTINCLAVAGTSAIITLNECDTAGATCAGVDGATTITCNTTASADDGALSNAAGDATDVYRIDVGTVTGAVSQLMVCMTYQVAD